MYLYHFGLTELPFTLTPNTAFYVGLEPHNEALAVLLTALKAGEGFIKVIGEVGTGKTLLCRKLLNEIPEHFVTAYIPNPYLKPDELRRAVAVELGVKQAQRMSAQLLTQRIQQRLLELHSAGHSVVLILDEAQALPEESLEALRLFTNLETETRKLLQVVLFAQPELDERLATTRFRQLKQRITFSYKLRAMTALEVQRYIQHRMQVAGYKGATLFNSALSKRVAKVSMGIPRLVNVLCHKMLMLSYGQGQYQITNKHLTAAIEDTEATRQVSYLKVYLSIAGVLLSTVLIAYVLKNYGVIA
ncbi:MULTISPECIES: ExeA family protein [unclassified Colwellia]|uniref:ExeA family protein n=1 Tax=unclassified Colwellia TaxID=196834 RepID=UPI0015F38E32|nr:MULTISPECIES: AAA family ATPase [unclassified Colwellia]MBA6232104.1 AAA family ATPase [Colwellia sp. MB02u-7]MBA6237198.1 AAA family ATPase [Colwellia sp. MB02u-11]MBA6257370.1 AAA family ATPase [Colwellia sp. MB3u-28]MBA6260442.1 AAA family ATPase [Colwellia sp. MB3u-41]MBA6301538.1 AAA family ATPase [Colwellia sp. MB3u-22]